MAIGDNPEDGRVAQERVTISVGTLRAELTALELRLVDRLNGALANKADRAIQDQVVSNLADIRGRLQILEATTLKREGPFVNMIEEHDKSLAGLANIANYRKWIWAQSLALLALGLPVAVYFMDQVVG